MKAKEMFEELGYKEVKEWSNIIHYENMIDEKFEQRHIIEFVVNHEFISVASKFGKFTYGAFNGIDVKLLQAINQQCKELGWLEDK